MPVKNRVNLSYYYNFSNYKQVIKTMKSTTLFFSILLFMVSSVSSQSLTGSILLDKSIQYHDPNSNWNSFKGTLSIEQLDTNKIKKGLREAILDLPKSYFKFTQKTGEDNVIRQVTGEECYHSYNGSTTIPEEINKKYRLTCERAKMYRNYYSYLYGLPMKLKDPGTHIDTEVKEDDFQGESCFSIRVTYDKEVGGDIWYFYFDKKSSRMIGYRFYHDESINDGEYITLEGEIEIEGIKMPKDRYWYMNVDDRFLGADLLVKKK